jgi:hypothetical protein
MLTCGVAVEVGGREYEEDMKVLCVSGDELDCKVFLSFLLFPAYEYPSSRSYVIRLHMLPVHIPAIPTPIHISILSNSLYPCTQFLTKNSML